MIPRPVLVAQGETQDYEPLVAYQPPTAQGLYVRYPPTIDTSEIAPIPPTKKWQNLQKLLGLKV